MGFAHGGDVFDYDKVNIFIMDQKPLKLWVIQGMANKGCAIVARGKYTDQQYLDKDQCYLPLVQLQELHTLKNQ